MIIDERHLHLPESLSAIIFSELEPNHLGLVRRTCWEFQKVVTKDHTIWWNMIESNFPLYMTCGRATHLGDRDTSIQNQGQQRVLHRDPVQLCRSILDGDAVVRVQIINKDLKTGCFASAFSANACYNRRTGGYRCSWPFDEHKEREKIIAPKEALRTPPMAMTSELAPYLVNTNANLFDRLTYLTRQTLFVS